MLHEIFWAPIPFKRYQNTSGCSTVNYKTTAILSRPTQKSLYQLLAFLNLYQYARTNMLQTANFRVP